MKQLESFTAYCKMYPTLRFWQALCNWSEYSAILGTQQSQSGDMNNILVGTSLCTYEDTFYKE